MESTPTRYSAGRTQPAPAGPFLSGVPGARGTRRPGYVLPMIRALLVVARDIALARLIGRRTGSTMPGWQRPARRGPTTTVSANSSGPPATSRSRRAPACPDPRPRAGSAAAARASSPPRTRRFPRRPSSPRSRGSGVVSSASAPSCASCSRSRASSASTSPADGFPTARASVASSARSIARARYCRSPRPPRRLSPSRYQIRRVREMVMSPDHRHVPTRTLARLAQPGLRLVRHREKMRSKMSIRGGKSGGFSRPRGAWETP